jgi:putative aldouronate transport system permease protein
VKSHRMPRGSIRRNLRQSSWLYAMFALPLAYFVVFHYLPMFGIVIAFKKYDAYTGFLRSPWVGITYFAQFFADPYFFKLVRNTFLLGLWSIVFSFAPPILLALLLNELMSMRYKKLVQTVSYMPHFLSTVVVVGMVVNFLASDGPINALFKTWKIGPFPFMSMPEWFRPVYIASGIWQGVGWGSIIYLAAITAIDPQLYEAAAMDGANRWRKMRAITLPGIAPTMTILLIITIGNVLNVSFEKVLLMQNAATLETSDVISTYVYRRGVIGADYSFAAAVGLFNSVLAFVFVAAANTASRRLSETSLW